MRCGTISSSAVVAASDSLPNFRSKATAVRRPSQLSAMPLVAPRQLKGTAELHPALDDLLETPPILRQLLPVKPARREDQIFVCDEESEFYSTCLERLMLQNSNGSETAIEFGSGDGLPVLNSLMRASFDGVIHGFELNATSADLAQSSARRLRLDDIYKVHNRCFFEGVQATSPDWLVANPPYIPAPDNNIRMPALHGGTDGSNLNRTLMQLGIDNAVLLISSYSNPVETMQHAQRQGYACTDFLVADMPFGCYSSEPKVLNHIASMRSEGRAFYTEDSYLLAGVLLRQQGSLLQQQLSGLDSSSDCSDSIEGAPPSSAGSTHSHSDRTDELLSILTYASRLPKDLQIQ